MPFVDAVVAGLNQRFQSSLSCFPSARLFGVAETLLIYEDDVPARYPAIIDNNAQAYMVDINRDYAVTLYHKVDSITNGINTKLAYGAAYGRESEVVNMALMVFAFRDAVLKPVYHLENLLKDSLPEKSTIQNIQATQYFAGNSSFDKAALLAREYSSTAVNYPELMVLELKYRIESTYRKGCFIANNNGC